MVMHDSDKQTISNVEGAHFTWRCRRRCRRQCRKAWEVTCRSWQSRCREGRGCARRKQTGKSEQLHRLCDVLDMKYKEGLYVTAVAGKMTYNLYRLR